VSDKRAAQDDQVEKHPAPVLVEQGEHYQADPKGNPQSPTAGQMAVDPEGAGGIAQD